MVRIATFLGLLLLLSCSAQRSTPGVSMGSTSPSDPEDRPLSGLQSGPMTGYSAMREASIWVQTTRPALVSVLYGPQEADRLTERSEEYRTAAQHGNTAELVLTDLIPGTKYRYELYIDGKHVARSYPLRFQTQTLWQYRTDPPPFTFAAGSCLYVNEEIYDRPGRPYGGDYEIMEEIIEDKPDFMLWLGDNNYLREVDYDSRSGVYARYTHSRSLPEIQALLGGTHHYAIWDDHDYGPNDSDRSYVGKTWTREAFEDFWCNPTGDVIGEGGITGHYQWADCDFFLLDNRWSRSDKRPDGQILGEGQMTWLREALRKSRAPYKFICTGGQVLNSAAVYENHAQFSQERDALLQMIDDLNVRGVIFINGDRHHSEVGKMVFSDGTPVYEITSSPLTSSAARKVDEKNDHLVAGSLITERNYALIEINGKRKKRSCTVSFKNVKGKTIYQYEIDSYPKK